VMATYDATSALRQPRPGVVKRKNPNTNPGSYGPTASTGSTTSSNTGFGLYDPQAAFNRDATLAQNAYSRFLAQQRGAREIADLDINRTRGLERFASSYGQRGLANSGIYQNAQNDYAKDWMQGRQDSLDRLYQELRAAEFGDAGAWQQFGSNVADTEEEKMQQILQTAAQLSQMKPFLGG